MIRLTVPRLVRSAQRHATTGQSGGHLLLLSSIGAQLLMPGALDDQAAKHAINRLREFVQADYRILQDDLLVNRLRATL